MKASTLADFVIVFVAISAIIILVSHMGLTWTTKEIPSGMDALGVTLAGGAVAAALRKSKAKLDNSIKGNFVNYSLMGLSTTQLFLVINYNALIWAERPISNTLSLSIHGFVIVILAVTNFGDSGYTKPESLPTEPTKDELIDQETEIDPNHNR